jgi:hypothetical protein
VVDVVEDVLEDVVVVEVAVVVVEDVWVTVPVELTMVGQCE